MTGPWFVALRRFCVRFKFYRSGTSRTLYVRLRSRDRHYLIVRWHTYTYGRVTGSRRADGGDGIINPPVPQNKERSARPWRVQLRGIWKGRGYVKIRWREKVNESAPAYFRLRRRNPVDHKIVRLRRLEVWW